MTKTRETATITRRGAIAAAGAAAMALAATSLTGCSTGSDEGNDSKEREYLPIGSVVKLASYEKTDIKHAVITRRPNLSKYYTKDSSGNVTAQDVSTIHDYALVAWPVGIINDINMVAGDIVLADAADIKEVYFVGYEDDLELEAQAALANGRTQGLNNAQSLQNIAGKLLASIPAEGN